MPFLPSRSPGCAVQVRLGKARARVLELVGDALAVMKDLGRTVIVVTQRGCGRARATRRGAEGLAATADAGGPYVSSSPPTWCATPGSAAARPQIRTRQGPSATLRRPGGRTPTTARPDVAILYHWHSRARLAPKRCCPPIQRLRMLKTQPGPLRHRHVAPRRPGAAAEGKFTSVAAEVWSQQGLGLTACGVDLVGLVSWRFRRVGRLTLGGRWWPVTTGRAAPPDSGRGRHRPRSCHRTAGR